MSEKFKTYDKEKAYFVTFTIVNWLEILRDDTYKMILVDAINYYKSNRGLLVYAYCIMHNHVHLIIQSNGSEMVSEVLRDLKKQTSKQITKKIIDENDAEKLKILEVFRKEGLRLKRIKFYKVWKDGNKPLMIMNSSMLWRIIHYIHNNPVERSLTEKPEDYLFCSARNYAELNSLIEIEYVTRELITH